MTKLDLMRGAISVQFVEKIESFCLVWKQIAVPLNKAWLIGAAGCSTLLTSRHNKKESYLKPVFTVVAHVQVKINANRRLGVLS